MVYVVYAAAAEVAEVVNTGACEQSKRNKCNFNTHFLKITKKVHGRSLTLLLPLIF